MKKVLSLLLCLLLLGCTPKRGEGSYIISDKDGREIERITERKDVEFLDGLFAETADQDTETEIGAVPDEEGLFFYSRLEKDQEEARFRVYETALTLSVLPRNGPTVSWSMNPETHAILTDLDKLHKALETK